MMQPGAIRSVVVCGAPRSGTSMLAGLLAAAGFHESTDLIPASPSNPHGFHEDVRVNRLNDELLHRLPVGPGAGELPRHLWWLAAHTSSSRPGDLTEVADDRSARDLLPPAPFVIKDPRFSFTLPAWVDVLGDVTTLVLVRPAAEVATSLLRMADESPEQFAGFDRADLVAIVERLWPATYRAILSWASESTYFLEMSALGDDDVRDDISRLLGRPIDGHGVDPELGSSAPFPDVVVNANIEATVAGRLRLDRQRLRNASPPSAADQTPSTGPWIGVDDLVAG